MHPLKGKKVLIIHYRVGRTDGVSLQIDAWKQILSSLGAQVKLCSGPINTGADFVIPQLESQLNPDIFTIDEESFGGLNTFKSNRVLNDQIRQTQQSIKLQFQEIYHKYQPDYLIISNIFSVGENIPASGALALAIDHAPVPTLAVHHDFYWESIRYKTPTNDFIRQQLATYCPPQRPWLLHACINTLAQAELRTRSHIDSTVLHDTFDFDQTARECSSQHRQLKDQYHLKSGDLVILQATRIVRRKNIELAIDLVKNLNKSNSRKTLSTKPLYNRHRFHHKNSQIILLLSGYAEYRDQAYLKQLLRYASQSRVQLRLLSDTNDPAINRQDDQNCGFWEAYSLADLITYPSQYEGFGNQFLEACYTRKPVALFEYPVFQSDIQPLGFKYLSFGSQLATKPNNLVTIPDQTLEQLTDQTIDILTNQEKYQSLVNHNFKLAKANFSFQKTSDHFLQIFSQLDQLKY